LSERPREGGLRLRQADARSEPSHHLDPVVVGVGEHPAAGDVGRRPGAHGEINVRGFGRIDAEELRRRNADDGERHVVDQNGLAGRARGIAEAPLAISHAQDRDRRSAGAIVVGTDQPAGRGRHGEAAKEVAGDVLTLRELRFPLDQHVHVACRLVGEEAGKDRRRDLLQPLERGEREDGGGNPRGVTIGAAVDRAQHEVVPPEVGQSGPPLHHHQ
jgi:hypothetical protein